MSMLSACWRVERESAPLFSTSGAARFQRAVRMFGSKANGAEMNPNRRRKAQMVCRLTNPAEIPKARSPPDWLLQSVPLGRSSHKQSAQNCQDRHTAGWPLYGHFLVAVTDYHRVIL